MKIIVSKKENKSAGKIFLYNDIKSLRSKCTKEEYQFLKNESSSNDVVEFGNYDTRKEIISSKKKAIEFFRKTAANLNLQGDFDLLCLDVSKTKAIAFLEGALLNDYSFLKYKKTKIIDNKINMMPLPIKPSVNCHIATPKMLTAMINFMFLLYIKSLNFRSTKKLNFCEKHRL